MEGSWRQGLAYGESYAAASASRFECLPRRVLKQASTRRRHVPNYLSHHRPSLPFPFLTGSRRHEIGMMTRACIDLSYFVLNEGMHPGPQRLAVCDTKEGEHIIVIIRRHHFFNWIDSAMTLGHVWHRTGNRLRHLSQVSSGLTRCMCTIVRYFTAKQGDTAPFDLIRIASR
jgi:hypothetical protein